MGLCHLVLNCIDEQNDTLYESKQRGDWWVTDTNDRERWKYFSVLLKLEIVHLSSKKCKLTKKNEQNSTFCPCHSYTHFYLCYTHIKRLFFYMGFHTNWLRVCILRGQLGPSAYIYSERFPNKCINNCACSMHRNDLHDGMFWSEILHELS